ncbi:MAG: GxxExxY protein [Anaerolineales bacterium]|nr:GxxExxY protein [Anaerolineales bacterium]
MSVFLHGEVTEQVIGAAFEVWKILGYGFLEKVYENALVVELKLRGVTVDQQHDIDVYYKSILVGQYTADLFAEDKVIVELKAEKEYNPKHEAQLLNYLKATGTHVGLLLNFGRNKCEFKRLVM